MRHLLVLFCGVPFVLLGCPSVQLSTDFQVSPDKSTSELASPSTGRTATLVGEIWCVGDAWSDDTMSAADADRVTRWQQQLSESPLQSRMEEACGAPIRACLDIASYKSETSAWPVGGMGEDGTGCEDGFKAVSRACRASANLKGRIASKVSQVACQRFHTSDPRDDNQADHDRDLGQFYDGSTKTLITRSWIRPRESVRAEVAGEKFVDDYTLSLWLAENM